MGCWINPTKTAHRKQQMKRALADYESSFATQNFYSTIEEQLYSSTLPENTTKLTTNNHPYRIDLEMQIIRRLSSSRNLWFRSTSFYQTSDGEIICKGDVLKLWFKPNNMNHYCYKMHNKSVNALETSKREVYVFLKNLHFSNDFLFKHKDDLPDVAGWLFKWFFSV